MAFDPTRAVAVEWAEDAKAMGVKQSEAADWAGGAPDFDAVYLEPKWHVIIAINLLHMASIEAKKKNRTHMFHPLNPFPPHMPTSHSPPHVKRISPISSRNWNRNRAQVSEGVFAAAARILLPGGLLYIHGPFWGKLPEPRARGGRRSRKPPKPQAFGIDRPALTREYTLADSLQMLTTQSAPGAGGLAEWAPEGEPAIPGTFARDEELKKSDKNAMDARLQDEDEEWGVRSEQVMIDLALEQGLELRVRQ